MPANWSNPVTTSLYTDVLATLKERDLDAATQFNNGTATSIPTGAIRWDGTLSRWQRWSGTAWAELATTYILTGLQVTSLNNTGNTTLGDSSADSVTVNAATWTFSSATTVAGAVTWSGAQTYSAATTFNGAFGVNSTASFGGLVNTGAGVSTGDVAIEHGAGRTGSGNAYFDFHAAAGTDFEARIIRYSGANGGMDIINAGNGGITVDVSGASDFVVRTNFVERLRIGSLGAITSSDRADALGYKGIPQNARTSAYTPALSDIGKHISITTGGITVPANGAVAFPIGSAITIYNDSASSQSIAITTDTMYLAGTATTGTRTLAQRGLATLVKVGTTTWVISGAGLT